MPGDPGTQKPGSVQVLLPPEHLPGSQWGPWGRACPCPPPAIAGAQRVVTEAWGAQLSGAWRHRGHAWGATLRLEKSPGFHPEN